MEKGGIPGTSPSPGLCAAVVALMICRGETKGKRVPPPAICIPPETFFEEYTKAGTKIAIDYSIMIQK